MRVREYVGPLAVLAAGVVGFSLLCSVSAMAMSDLENYAPVTLAPMNIIDVAISNLSTAAALTEQSVTEFVPTPTAVPTRTASLTPQPSDTVTVRPTFTSPPPTRTRRPRATATTAPPTRTRTPVPTNTHPPTITPSRTPSPVPPTNTPVPTSTHSPIPPTNTPVPPTNTSVPPTATDEPPTVAPATDTSAPPATQDSDVSVPVEDQPEP
ncbi:MAG TPA: hypothetical protein VK897_08805 [Anaerolineales bacterium]|nr:hypothetical protein [Anaerolineales bacterium]